MSRLSRRLALLAATALSVLALPAGAQAATPGVNIAGAPTPERVDAAIATGAKHVRIFAYWNEFEPDTAADFPEGNPNSRNLRDVFVAATDKMNAAGVQPIFVVLGAPKWANGGGNAFTPPTSPATYAAFFAEFVSLFAGKQVAAYEVWNEPDEKIFWQPGPDAAAYAALLKAAYAAGNPVKGGAQIVAGPTTGNNYNWIQGLYDNGAKGSFDGVAVHTDTACLDRGPDFFYREGAGRLGQFTFLGYREVRATMLANGEDKPIWMSELGWSTTTKTCDRGASAGNKPAGVSRADQARFLTHAYQCLALDPYVVAGTWFTMQDAAANTDELSNYGLLDVAGRQKESYAPFKAVTAANGGGPGPCGDFDAPVITVSKPFDGQQFVDKLDLSAAADDGSGVGVGRISYAFDGGQEIRNFTSELTGMVGLAPWQGSGKLALGKHTIEVIALDKNGNTATKVVNVEKVSTMAANLTPAFKLGKKVTCKGRVCKLTGSLSRGAAGRPSIGGKVQIRWEWKNKQGRWTKLSGGLKPASKAFAFTLKAKKAGAWRVQVLYAGQAPYKKASSKRLTFRVR